MPASADRAMTDERRRAAFRRRLLAVGAVTATISGLTSSQVAFAEDGDGRAEATMASVNINSNVEPIDLNLQGSSGSVETPPGIGVVADDDDFVAQYLDSSLTVNVEQVEAQREPGDVNAISDSRDIVFTLLGNEIMTVDEVASVAACPNGDAAFANAAAVGIDFGTGPETQTLGPGESFEFSVTIVSDVFESGSAVLDIEASTSATSSDSAAAAEGLHVDVSVTGEPVGVGGGPIQGIIDGTIDIGLTECVADGLAHTGADMTIVISLAAVLFLAAGGSALLWSRRRMT